MAAMADSVTPEQHATAEKENREGGGVESCLLSLSRIRDNCLCENVCVEGRKKGRRKSHSPFSNSLWWLCEKGRRRFRIMACIKLVSILVFWHFELVEKHENKAEKIPGWKEGIHSLHLFLPRLKARRTGRRKRQVCICACWKRKKIHSV